MEAEAREVLFAPSIYEHAARDVERSPWDVSRDAGLMARAHIEAYRLYEHRPIVVGFDIYNLEAEAYGAKIDQPSGNGIPAITSHPYSSTKELLGLEAFDPTRDGRIAMVMDSEGRPHVSYPYVKDGEDAIAYAYKDGDTWQCQIVHQGSTGMIALDRDDKPSFVAISDSELFYLSR